ncbi:CRE-UGT-54 protein, partial [Aphelenchoides avenae]
MLCFIRLFWALLCLLVPVVYSFKALVITTNAGYSHVQFNGKLADLLVEAGHDVHFFVAAWNPAVSANGSKLAQKITQYKPSNAEELAEKASKVDFFHNHFEDREIEVFTDKQTQHFVEGTWAFCKELLTDAKTMQELRNAKYRVGIAEQFDSCSFILFHALGIPTTIASSALAISELNVYQLGLPSPPSFVPELNKAPISSPHLGYFERALNLYNNLFTTPYILSRYDAAIVRVFLRVVSLIRSLQTERARTLFPDTPTWLELFQQASFLFVNSHELLEISRPVTHKVKHIGGVVHSEPKELSNKLRGVFDTAAKGVVYFSFGSIVDTKSMPTRVRDVFLESFAEFPEYTFIWKIAGSSEDFKEAFVPYMNVYPFEWVDQASILAHPKTKAFISHCGMNSLNEAAFNGVPIIAVPFFGDQNYNAAIVTHKRIGVYLQRTNITTESVTGALRELLEND